MSGEPGVYGIGSILFSGMFLSLPLFFFERLSGTWIHHREIPRVKRLRSVVILLVIGMSGLYPQGSAMIAANQEGIKATADIFSAAYMRGDIETMMDCYTDDAVILPGGRDIIEGPENLRAYWTLPPGRSVTYHRSMTEGITVVGNTAYDYGYYEGANSRDGADPVPFRGKYVIIWEKGDDGKWRMKVDMWNTRAGIEQ